MAIGAFFTHLWHRYLVARLRRRMRHGDQADLEAKLREYHDRWHDDDAPGPKKHDNPGNEADQDPKEKRRRRNANGPKS